MIKKEGCQNECLMTLFFLLPVTLMSVILSVKEKVELVVSFSGSFFVPNFDNYII